MTVTKDNWLSDIGVTLSFIVEMLSLRLRKKEKNLSIMITATAHEKPIDLFSLYVLLPHFRPRDAP